MHILQVLIDVLFAIGLFINSCLFIPQIIKLIKVKDSRDLSKITFIGFNTMQLIAAIYGAIHGDLILLIGNSLSFISCGLVTVLIYVYRK